MQAKKRPLGWMFEHAQTETKLLMCEEHVKRIIRFYTVITTVTYINKHVRQIMYLGILEKAIFDVYYLMP